MLNTWLSNFSESDLYMSVSLRKNVRNLTTDEINTLSNAYRSMMQIRDTRGYNHIAGFHGAPNFYCWHHQFPRLFLPWHRAYLYWFEQAAKDQVDTVTIPWWDWSSNISGREGIPRIFADEDVDGEPNPLYKAHINVPTTTPPLDMDTFRTPRRPSELPNRDEVDRVLALSDFGDFNDGLEDIHDQIHGWAGGTMGRVATAAFDPIFWSHHCMIDRIWWLWQLRHGNSGIPADMIDNVLEPFNMTVRGVLNIYRLGYDYAGTQVSPRR
jgi:tyrosinase